MEDIRNLALVCGGGEGRKTKFDGKNHAHVDGATVWVFLTPTEKKTWKIYKISRFVCGKWKGKKKIGEENNTKLGGVIVRVLQNPTEKNCGLHTKSHACLW